MAENETTPARESTTAAEDMQFEHVLLEFQTKVELQVVGTNEAQFRAAVPLDREQEWPSS